MNKDKQDKEVVKDNEEECCADCCECHENCEDCKDCCGDCQDLKDELEKERQSKLVALADLVNYRKRMEREREDLFILANKQILMQIIDIVDDFERAKTDKGYKDEGMEMILRKLTNLLLEYVLEEIECNKGIEFDPQAMEAVSAMHTENKNEKNKVMDIIAKGYRNKRTGMIFKSAKVIIGK